MAILVSSGYELARIGDPRADYPVVGWQNLVTATTVAADHEAAGYPATNLSTPATNDAEQWKSDSTGEQYVTVLFGAEHEVDYVGIARHNFGSGGIVVTVEGLPFGGDPNEPSDWVELVEPAVVAGDVVHMARFEPTWLIGLRLKLQPDAVAPKAAVLHVGKLLEFERGVQPGNPPLVYARERDVQTPISQSGQYLGLVVSGGRRRAAVNIIKLTPEWYRSILDPFLDVVIGQPFFWAWRPMTYPNEVAYAWVTSQPMPAPDMAGYIDITMQMEGLL